MKNINLQEDFITRLNEFLPIINFKKLDKSCNSEDDGYAKNVLKKMHDIFLDVYKTDSLDSNDYEFVEVPAIVMGKNTGHIELAILLIDIESSGENCDTFFLTPRGVISQGSKELLAHEKDYINQTYIPYEYWRTVSIESDIHVCFDNMPDKILEMINICNAGHPEMEME